MLETPPLRSTGNSIIGSLEGLTPPLPGTLRPREGNRSPKIMAPINS